MSSCYDEEPENCYVSNANGVTLSVIGKVSVEEKEFEPDPEYTEEQIEQWAREDEEERQRQIERMGPSVPVERLFESTSSSDSEEEEVQEHVPVAVQKHVVQRISAEDERWYACFIRDRIWDPNDVEGWNRFCRILGLGTEQADVLYVNFCQEMADMPLDSFHWVVNAHDSFRVKLTALAEVIGYAELIQKLNDL